MPRISADPARVRMGHSLYINGRFLAQPLSGVQRFATEMTAALARMSADRGTTSPVVLTPPGPVAAETAPNLASIMEVRAVGTRHGQIWEQTELAGHARDGILLNLGNTAPLRGRRQVVVIHDAGVYQSPETYPWTFRTWYKFMQGRLIHGQTRVVAVSQFARGELIRYFGAPRSDIQIIGEGADHMLRLVPDRTVLERNGLQPGRFVLAVGNLAAHKNLARLHEAAQALAARGFDLVITGGLDRGVFKRRGDGVPMPAKYIGRVSDEALRALYEAAACFVFPSLYEGFGLPAVEAMICGCPVVAADIPALREVCGQAALFCTPTDGHDIAAKICQLLDDPSARDDLRRRMHEHVQRHTWDNAARDLRSVVDSMCC